MFQSTESARAAIGDPFSLSMSMSDSDRRHDAWIPSQKTREILVAMVTSDQGSYTPDSDSVTRPGVLLEEDQVYIFLNTQNISFREIRLINIHKVDPVKELVIRYMGEQEAQKRQFPTVDTVSQDENGLRVLLVSL